MSSWFTVDTNLQQKPEVVTIAASAKVAVEVVIGRLVLFWSLVDSFGVPMKPKKRKGLSSLDGVLPNYTPEVLAATCCGDVNFWEEVARAGWISFAADGARVPGFDARFSKGAKARRKNAQSQRKTRQLKDDAKPGTSDGRHVSVTKKRDTTVTKCDVENRRVEKRTEPTENKTPPPPPEVEAVSWTKATAAVRSAGVADFARTIAAAKAAGRSAADVLDDCAAWPERSSRFDSIGSLVFRIKSGHWPKAKERAGPSEREELIRRHGAKLVGLSPQAERILCEEAGVVFDESLGGIRKEDELTVLRYLASGQAVPA